jgi:hypothetical protein
MSKSISGVLPLIQLCRSNLAELPGNVPIHFEECHVVEEIEHRLLAGRRGLGPQSPREQFRCGDCGNV